MKKLIVFCSAVLISLGFAQAQSPCSSVVDSDLVAVTDTKGTPVILSTDTGAGCDADKDGVADEEDKCPSIPGVASNMGCPEVDAETKEALAETVRDLRFKTGSAELEDASKVILDKLAAILNKEGHTSYKIHIEGHTDNTGSAEINNKLSAERAQAAKDYLVQDGVSEGRLTAQGFGSSKPIASNDTAEGRKENRRVEFNVFF